MSAIQPGFHLHGSLRDLQQPFDVAVVMPTVGRDSLVEAMRSVFAQTGVARIQLLIGVDQPVGRFTGLQDMLSAVPPHVCVGLLWPGYSTSSRHGGPHAAADGGALRSLLTYMANARHVAYLDDDNRWEPGHLRSLLAAVSGRDWAFALRWFVHPQTLQRVCIDNWESTGPGRGSFAERFGGFVDPNCLLIDKIACEPAIRCWSVPLPGDASRLTADRHVYDWLQRKSEPGETGMATVDYTMNEADMNHPLRVQRAGSLYAAAGQRMAPQRRPSVSFITVCKGRLHHLQQTLPSLLAQPDAEVIVVDYGCPQGAGDWVRTHHPAARVIDVRDDTGFCVARARNLGAAQALADVLFFVDADVILDHGISEWLKENTGRHTFCIAQPYVAELCGTFTCPRTAFELVEGYDEAIRGWGGEDTDLYYRLEKAGVQAAGFPSNLANPIQHGDEERTLFYPIKKEATRHFVWQFYLNAKADLMELHPQPLTLKQRQALYRLCEAAALKGQESALIDPIEIYVDLGERTEQLRFNEWRLERFLRYRLMKRTVSQT